MYNERQVLYKIRSSVKYLDAGILKLQNFFHVYPNPIEHKGLASYMGEIKPKRKKPQIKGPEGKTSSTRLQNLNFKIEKFLYHVAKIFEAIFTGIVGILILEFIKSLLVAENAHFFCRVLQFFKGLRVF